MNEITPVHNNKRLKSFKISLSLIYSILMAEGRGEGDFFYFPKSKSNTSTYISDFLTLLTVYPHIKTKR